MKARVTLNYKALNQIKEDSILALVKTADAVKTDLVDSQTMPYGNDTTPEAKKRKYQAGSLQSNNTSVDKTYQNKGIVRIVSDTPYARRLYFHPEYNFYQGHNSKAGGMWFHPYIDGDKKSFARNAFRRFMRSKYK